LHSNAGLSYSIEALGMTNSEGEVTQLLNAMKNGGPSAAKRLLQLVYAEFRRLASPYMRRPSNFHGDYLDGS
jgi:plasmid stabilization system protein ParE